MGIRIPAPLAVALHGSTSAPVYVTGSVHRIVTVEGACSIANHVEPVEPVWLTSPEYVAQAEALPTFRLSVKVTGVTEVDSPPSPVAFAVHAGVIGSPVYTCGPAGHQTVVSLVASVISKLAELSSPKWLSSPSYVAVAVAVPTSMLLA